MAVVFSQEPSRMDRQFELWCLWKRFLLEDAGEIKFKHWKRQEQYTMGKSQMSEAEDRDTENIYNAHSSEKEIRRNHPPRQIASLLQQKLVSALGEIMPL